MKFLGGVFILLASVLCAYHYEKRLKTKSLHIQELSSFITYIKSQIEYFSYPINTIFERYEAKSEFINEIIKNPDCLKSEGFDSDIQNTLLNFFSSLGKGYKKEQLSLCDYTISSLSSYVQALKKEYPSKVKVFRSMSLFVGISIVILIV